MDASMADAFFQDVESWRPDEATEGKYRDVLRRGKTPEDRVEPLVEGWTQASLASYRYLEAVHDLARVPSLDRKSFVERLARMVGALEGLRLGHAAFRKAFGEYHAETAGQLSRDHFDTLYYDAIQNFDVKSALKDILKDVDLLLKSFSLVSADLAGVRCLELYEDCVRFHLYTHYLLMKTPVAREECWSVLFDLNNLFGAEDEADPEGDLEDLQEALEEVRHQHGCGDGCDPPGAAPPPPVNPA